MIKSIRRWWKQPAYWWEFWLPNSGLRGGIIVAVLLILIFATSGCSCMGPNNDTQACVVVKRVALTSALLSAGYALRNSCDRDNRDRVHLPSSPDCASGSCR